MAEMAALGHKPLKRRRSTEVVLTFQGAVAPTYHDGPFLLLVEHESTGVLYFGPFRTYAAAEKAAARSERITGESMWSIEALQPGSFMPEWCRIIMEDADERDPA